MRVPESFTNSYTGVEWGKPTFGFNAYVGKWINHKVAVRLGYSNTRINSYVYGLAPSSPWMNFLYDGTFNYVVDENGNFVLDFSATDYDFVQIVYGRDTWNDPMISNIFYKNANNEFYCALSISYGYSSSYVVMSCAFLTISGTNATYDSNRSVRVDIENTITRSNVNAINVYKVIGYK